MIQVNTTRSRLNLSQEGMLWKVALAHLGATGLQQAVGIYSIALGPNLRAAQWNTSAVSGWGGTYSAC